MSSAHKERKKEKEHRLKYLKNQYQLYAVITTAARPNLDKQRIWPKFTLTKVHPYQAISFHTVFNPFTPSMTKTEFLLTISIQSQRQVMRI